MITAVDTNVLLDIVTPNAAAAESSEAMLTEALDAGSLVISESVYAELVSFFESVDRLESFRADTGIRLLPSTPETLQRAGWPGSSTRRVVPLPWNARRAVSDGRCAVNSADR